MEKLKRISKELDRKMSRLRVNKDPKEEKGSTRAKLEGELECVGKLILVYKKEKEALLEKLKKKTGIERVAWLENQVLANKQQYEHALKSIKERHKKNKEKERKFEKIVTRIEQGQTIMQVRFKAIIKILGARRAENDK